MDNVPNNLNELGDEFFKQFVMKSYVGGQVGYPVQIQSLQLERYNDKVIVKLFPNADEVCITFTFLTNEVLVDKPILYAGLVEDNLNDKYNQEILDKLSK